MTMYVNCYLFQARNGLHKPKKFVNDKDENNDRLESGVNKLEKDYLLVSGVYQRRNLVLSKENRKY